MNSTTVIYMLSKIIEDILRLSDYTFGIHLLVGPTGPEMQYEPEVMYEIVVIRQRDHMTFTLDEEYLVWRFLADHRAFFQERSHSNSGSLKEINMGFIIGTVGDEKKPYGNVSVEVRRESTKLHVAGKPILEGATPEARTIEFDTPLIPELITMLIEAYVRDCGGSVPKPAEKMTLQRKLADMPENTNSLSQEFLILAAYKNLGVIQTGNHPTQEIHLNQLLTSLCRLCECLGIQLEGLQGEA